MSIELMNAAWKLDMQTGLETSAVAGRVNELLEAGALFFAGKKKPGGRDRDFVPFGGFK